MNLKMHLITWMLIIIDKTDITKLKERLLVQAQPQQYGLKIKGVDGTE
jgi:hypothetical protein